MKSILMVLFFSLLLLTPSMSQAQNLDEEKQKLFSQTLPYLLKETEKEENICIITKGNSPQEETLIKGYLTQFDANTITINTQDKNIKTVDFNNIKWVTLYSLPAEIQLNDGTVIDCWIEGFTDERVCFNRIKKRETECVNMLQIKKITPGVTKQMKAEKAKYDLKIGMAIVINIFSVAFTGKPVIQM